MTVNGRPRWTCRTHVSKVARGGRLTIAPLENLPAHVAAASRYNPADYAGVVNEYIAGREFVLIVARSLVEGRHRIAQPADILGHTLLHHEGVGAAGKLAQFNTLRSCSDGIPVQSGWDEQYSRDIAFVQILQRLLPVLEHRTHRS